MGKSEFDIIANMGEHKISIGGKMYEIKSPVLRVHIETVRKIKQLLKDIDFDIERDIKNKPIEEIVGVVLTKIYENIMNPDKYEKIMTDAAYILALLINNKVEKKWDENDVTPDDILDNMQFKEILGLLQEVLKFTEVDNFLLIMAQMAQAMDIEKANEVSSTSQD